jgi:hypothetical protein
MLYRCSSRSFGNVELIAVLRGECGWFGVILFVENPCEEVVLELRDKVLEERQHQGRGGR